MNKYLIAILIVMLASPVGATTYYACIAGDINAANAWEDAAGCDGSTFTYGTGGFPAAGSVLNANNQAMTVNTDPGPNGKVVLTNPAGGAFTSSGNITITADVGVDGDRGSVDCLTIGSGTVTLLGDVYGGDGSGADGLVISGAGTAVTIGSSGAGTVTIKGGSAATGYGVNDSHTAATTTVYANITGGTNSTAAGYSHNAAGTVAITGNITGGAAHGIQNLNSSSTITVAGDCIGSATVAASHGCNNLAYGTFTVTGNIINGAAGSGVAGKVRWEPSSAQKYIKFDAGGTAIYAGAGLGSDAGGTQVSAANTAAEISTGKYFIKKDDGAYTQGTKSAGGGGGAWGF